MRVTHESQLAVTSFIEESGFQFWTEWSIHHCYILFGLDSPVNHSTLCLLKLKYGVEFMPPLKYLVISSLIERAILAHDGKTAYIFLEP